MRGNQWLPTTTVMEEQASAISMKDERPRLVINVVSRPIHVVFGTPSAAAALIDAEACQKRAKKLHMDLFAKLLAETQRDHVAAQPVVQNDTVAPQPLAPTEVVDVWHQQKQDPWSAPPAADHNALGNQERPCKDPWRWFDPGAIKPPVESNAAKERRQIAPQHFPAKAGKQVIGNQWSTVSRSKPPAHIICRSGLPQPVALRNRGARRAERTTEAEAHRRHMGKNMFAVLAPSDDGCATVVAPDALLTKVVVLDAPSAPPTCSPLSVSKASPPTPPPAAKEAEGDVCDTLSPLAAPLVVESVLPAGPSSPPGTAARRQQPGVQKAKRERKKARKQELSNQRDLELTDALLPEALSREEVGQDDFETVPKADGEETAVTRIASLYKRLGRMKEGAVAVASLLKCNDDSLHRNTLEKFKGEMRDTLKQINDEVQSTAPLANDTG